MKNRQLFNILNSMNNFSNLVGIKFVYAMAKNKALITAEIKSITKLRKTLSEEMLIVEKEYEKERIALNIEHSSKDKENNPVINNNQYQIINLPAFQKELKALDIKYKDFVDSRDKMVKENEELLEKAVSKEIASKLHKIKKEDLPEAINLKQLEPIMDLIQE